MSILFIVIISLTTSTITAESKRNEIFLALLTETFDFKYVEEGDKIKNERIADNSDYIERHIFLSIII